MSKTIIKVDSKIEDGGLVDLLIKRNLLSEIINIFPFIIIGMDKDLNLKYYNDVAEEYFKYKRNNILNKEFTSTLVRKKDRNQIKKGLNKAIKTLKIDSFIETPMMTKDNQLKFVNFILMLVIKDKKFNLLLMAGSDNTKRQKAKMELDKVCEELISKNEELVFLHKQLQGRDKRLSELKQRLQKTKNA